MMMMMRLGGWVTGPQVKGGVVTGARVVGGVTCALVGVLIAGHMPVTLDVVLKQVTSA